MHIEEFRLLILFAPSPSLMRPLPPPFLQRRLRAVTPWLTPAFFIPTKRKSVTDGKRSAEPDQSQ
jgi:hypothetical protein